MKIAILSDTHDNIPNTKWAVAEVIKNGADVLLFCGDFCAPRAGLELCEFKGPIYVVWGNNDGDKMNISRLMNAANDKVTFFPEADAVFELDGRKIAMTHYPFYAQALARTGDYDLVCFGHDHKARVETHGKCLAVNPGSLNAVRSTDIMGFALYDTTTHKAILHKLDGSFLEI